MPVMKNGASGCDHSTVCILCLLSKSTFLKGPVNSVTLLLGCVPQLLGPTKQAQKVCYWNEVDLCTQMVWCLLGEGYQNNYIDMMIFSKKSNRRRKHPCRITMFGHVCEQHKWFVRIWILQSRHFTNSNLSNLKALLHCSINLKTAPFLSIVLRHAVISAKKGIP